MKIHSLELTRKWRMAPWKTSVNYKQGVFHLHVSSRESIWKVRRIDLHRRLGRLCHPLRSAAPLPPSAELVGGSGRRCSIEEAEAAQEDQNLGGVHQELGEGAFVRSSWVPGQVRYGITVIGWQSVMSRIQASGVLPGVGIGCFLQHLPFWQKNG